MIKNIIPLLIVLGVVFVSGCSEYQGKTDDALSLLETEVYYTQKMALHEGATLEVRLEDVSKMDASSELISAATRGIRNTPPYALQIAFPTESIKAKHRYSLTASIKLDEKLLFISTTNINPFEIGIASPIKIKVDKVGK